MIGWYANSHHWKETELPGRLREAGVGGVYILGLATDNCVKFTALDSRQLGFETWLIPEGTRPSMFRLGMSSERKLN